MVPTIPILNITAFMSRNLPEGLTPPSRKKLFQGSKLVNQHTEEDDNGGTHLERQTLKWKFELSVKLVSNAELWDKLGI